MNEELGWVVEVGPGRAKVEVKRSSACQHCGAASLCFTFGKDTNIVEVADPIGVKVGQRVRMSLGTTSFLKASAVLFVAPLLALIVGFFIGYSLGGQSELLSLLIGLLAMGATFWGIRLLEAHFSRQGQYRPAIVEVVEG